MTTDKTLTTIAQEIAAGWTNGFDPECISDDFSQVPNCYDYEYAESVIDRPLTEAEEQELHDMVQALIAEAVVAQDAAHGDLSR